MRPIPRREPDTSASEPDLLRDQPRHGFQGDRVPAAPPPAGPASLTIAISREAGSRGTSIARRAGAKLGWQVYTQELLEYLVQEGSARPDMVEPATGTGASWSEQRLESLVRDLGLGRHPSLVHLARTILTLGARGEVILIGRGAGSILPPQTTLHVRVVAPLPDRVAYMSQWQRLTHDEAAAMVRQRDQRRAEFIETHFHRQAADVYQYDLLLNSSLLGEDLCAELIAQAARAKLALLGQQDYMKR